jgi:hypothetical protein
LVIITDYWHAVSAYHAASDPEAKHQARVALMQIALNGSGRVAERARDILANEGVLIIRGQPAHRARAVERP